MKIAVAKEGNRVSGHFGHCEGFQVFEVEDQKIISSTFLKNPGHQPGVLPKFLRDHSADIVISGGMGAKAQQLFNENDIEVVVGATGSMEDAVESFLKGELQSTGSVCHDHSHSGSCGNH
ncbi:MAG: NifB/NifX family molybdenum-iron cluster-binding protein [Clostridia bacterium]|nr:NifB/NifX family molybdenum-iron cluster-binding protein [Clostridia bacterium]